MLPDRRRVLISLATFTLVFAGLNLPVRAFGRAVTAGTCALAGAVLSGEMLGGDLVLRVVPAPRTDAGESDVDQAWTAVLRAERVSRGAHVAFTINLRRALWVPLAVFIALAIASPIWRSVRGVRVLLTGVLLLQLPIALSLVTHAIGLLYEGYVVDLSELEQSLVRFSYGLLAPPGVVYATPLLLWAALVYATRPKPVRPSLATEVETQSP